MPRPGKKNPAKKPPEDTNNSDPCSILQKLKLQGRAKSRMSLDFSEDSPLRQDNHRSSTKISDRGGADVSNDGCSNDEMDLNENEDMPPDWYEDLTDDVMLGFKELFDTLDAAKTGILNADNLYEGLKKIDGDITREEVESVLKKLDKDGNGEIDFDEFLYHMTQGPDAGEETGKKRGAMSKRQRMFYTALNTIKNIERSYFARLPQSPHVLSHYTAGARLIGLTDRQLAKQMKKMQKDAKQHDSPYAKPLPFVSQGGSVKTTRRRTRGGTSTHFSKYQLATERTQIGGGPSPKSPDHKEVKMMLPPTPQSPPDYNEEPESPILFEHGKLGTNVFKESVRLFSSARGGIFSKFKDMMSNQKRFSIVADMMPSFKKESETVLHVPKLAKSSVEKEEITSSKTPETKTGGCGWKSKTVDFDKVPLPVLKIKYKKSRPTIDDLPDIREKAKQSINDYYRKLRRATVKNSFEHWERLYADTIRSKKLLENFRTVYRAYSPHKEEEAFVVAPWTPGPYRHTGSRNNGTSPGSRQESCICWSPDPTYVRRPVTAL